MNRCEKYADWIEEAALGALALEREREFLAHTAGCGACREAYQRACEIATLVDRGVESLVAGAPSPHFAVRLRARIAEEPSRAGLGWLTWKPVAAAFVAAGVLAFIVISGMPRHASPERGAIRSAAETASIERPSQLKPTTNQAQVRHCYQPFTENQAELARLVLPRHAGARRALSSREPQVIVPPGELEAVLQLVADIHSGRVDGGQLIAANENLDKPVTIKPIEITPLKQLVPKATDPTGHPAVEPSLP
jgi:hypothetical protein